MAQLRYHLRSAGRRTRARRRGAALQGDLVRLLVGGPQGAFLDVARVELPVFVGVVEAFKQAAALLFVEMWRKHFTTVTPSSARELSKRLIWP